MACRRYSARGTEEEAGGKVRGSSGWASLGRGPLATSGRAGGAGALASRFWRSGGNQVVSGERAFIPGKS